MEAVSTETKDKKAKKGRLKKVLKLGGTYAITLPKDFASDAEYLIVKEMGDGLLIKKAKVVEEVSLPPPTPEPPSRRSGRRAS
jgi:hypothetical protein